MICAIVAVDEDWGIGYNNALLERIPGDMKRFKELTTGNIVIMGTKTWESLPEKPLPERKNFVLTSHPKEDKEVWFGDMEALDELIDYYLEYETRKANAKKLCVIGGASVYKQLLPKCERVYLTKIYKHHDNVDAYFPNLDNDPDWRMSSSGTIKDYEGIKYQYFTYDKWKY